MMLNSRTLTATCLISALIAGSSPAGAQTPPSVPAAELRKKLETFVPAAMSALNVVPGVSVAVIRGGDVIYSGAFGVADVKAATPVTRDTVFYTASLAKSFTGMAAAVLISQGKLSLDAPLTQFFPGLKVPDGANAAKATVRGLLSHDPGFGNPTVNYVTTFVRPYTDAELIHILNTYSQPLNQFTYANTNYALTASIIEKVTGRPWRDLVADLVFAPLGMTHTTAFVSRARNVAQPYAAEAEGFVLMPLSKTDRTITGAGGVYSTADDLARFVEASLNRGLVDGRQALPAEAVRLVQTPLVSLQTSYGYYKRTGYGIGLYSGTYEGEPILHHFGSITGYKAHLSYLPQRATGVVVLGNEGADGARFTDLIASYIYDVLLGKDADALAASRIEEYKAGITRARTQRAGPRREWLTLSQSPGTPALPLAAYAGKYHSERLGDLEVLISGRSLLITFGDLRGDAIPIKDHEYLISWRDGAPPDRWTFVANGSEVTGFSWSGRDFVRTR